MFSALIFCCAVVAVQATYPSSGVRIIDDTGEWLKMCLLMALYAGCALLSGVCVSEWCVDKNECGCS